MRTFTLLFILVLAASAAPMLATVPSEIDLHRAGQSHRVVVELQEGDQWLGDRTADAVFATSDAAVAAVDETGNITAVGDGTATISAVIDGQTTTATVTVAGSDQPFDWSFRNHIQPVLFKMGCNTGACHGAAAGKNGFKLSLRGFDHDWDHAALTRQAMGRRVSLAEPAESLILLKATMGVPHEGGERFTRDSEAYRRLRAWIEAGAPAISADDKRIERLEVLPVLVTLPPESRQQLLVRAHYSDGSYEDVTEWAKFDTTEDTVAQVDQNGLVTVLAPGSTAITVWYSSKVSFADVLAPRQTPLDDAVIARAQRNNFIDELILKKLAALNIAPSGTTSDTEFIRRAYLDTLGILPTEDEVVAFVMENNGNKRAQLVDQLLERPEFVDYWAYKWSDLFLLSSKNLPKREELNAFYRYIRDSVAENKPWDEFARGILTAKGNTLENGAAAYFVMHKEITDVNETTSQAFLGMSLTCARCHNHPLEKWTQNDYYGAANLLSRVKLKNGENGGTEVVPAAFGDVIHPRLGEALPPRPLDGEAIPADTTVDRREFLADWLTAPENPYFTRAVVNRVWKNFMGTGLVEPVDDLRLTNPASNEELLNALAQALIGADHDLKALMRLIMNSAAYQRSSEPSDPAMPDDRFYSQYIIRRLDAEVILDTYSQVTDVPTKFEGYPDGFRALQLPDSQVASYFLTAFGRPERNQTCACERTEDASVAQTLHLANGDTLNDKLRDEDSYVGTLITLDDVAAVDSIFLRALARYPTPAEREQAVAALVDTPASEDVVVRREALEDIAWAVLSSKEFLFNH